MTKTQNKQTFEQVLTTQVLSGKIDNKLWEIGYHADKQSQYTTNFIQEIMLGHIALAYTQHLDNCKIELDKTNVALQLANKLNFCKFSDSYVMFMHKQYINEKFEYTYTFEIDLKNLNNYLAKELNSLFVGLQLEPIKEQLQIEEKIKNDEIQELNAIISSYGYTFEL